MFELLLDIMEMIVLNSAQDFRKLVMMLWNAVDMAIAWRIILVNGHVSVRTDIMVMPVIRNVQVWLLSTTVL